MRATRRTSMFSTSHKHPDVGTASGCWQFNIEAEPGNGVSDVYQSGRLAERPDGSGTILATSTDDDQGVRA